MRGTGTWGTGTWGTSTWGTGAAALLLMAAGGLLWRAGQRDAQLAEAERSLVTLQYARAAEQAAALGEPGLAGSRVPGAQETRAQVRSTRAWVEYVSGIAERRIGERETGSQASPRNADPRDSDTRVSDATTSRAAMSGAAISSGDAFLAANAAHAAAIQPDATASIAPSARIAQLDDAIGQYADVMRATPGHADAAYNYELAIRQRAAIAAAARAGAPASVPTSASASAATASATAATAQKSSAGGAGSSAAAGPAAGVAGAAGPVASAPAGSSASGAASDPRARALHGAQGAPPAGADVKSFKVIVPMRPEERQEAEGASKSGPRPRKG